MEEDLSNSVSTLPEQPRTPRNSLRLGLMAVAILGALLGGYLSWRPLDTEVATSDTPSNTASSSFEALTQTPVQQADTTSSVVDSPVGAYPLDMDDDVYYMSRRSGKSGTVLYAVHPVTLEEREIARIHNGGYYSDLILRNGKLYAWNMNEPVALEQLTIEGGIPVITLKEKGRHITDVRSYGDGFVVLTTVYTPGDRPSDTRIEWYSEKGELLGMVPLMAAEAGLYAGPRILGINARSDEAYICLCGGDAGYLWADYYQLSLKTKKITSLGKGGWGDGTDNTYWGTMNPSATKAVMSHSQYTDPFTDISTRDSATGATSTFRVLMPGEQNVGVAGWVDDTRVVVRSDTAAYVVNVEDHSRTPLITYPQGQTPLSDVTLSLGRNFLVMDSGYVGNRLIPSIHIADGKVLNMKKVVDDGSGETIRFESVR